MDHESEINIYTIQYNTKFNLIFDNEDGTFPKKF